MNVRGRPTSASQGDGGHGASTQQSSTSASDDGRARLAPLDEAAAALGRGQVVGLPTDTVYGLAVAPGVPGATDRLFALKRRPRSSGLPVLVADVDQAEALAGPDGLPRVALRLAARFWPGALTIVVTRRLGLTWDLGADGDTIALRCPADEQARALCRRVGPLATTSANRHGAPPLTEARQLRDEFAAQVSVVLEGRCLGTPSTVIDVTAAGVRCVRRGAVPWEEVLAAT